MQIEYTAMHHDGGSSVSWHNSGTHSCRNHAKRPGKCLPV